MSVVDKIRVMLGSFSPQQEPYTYIMDEETTPAGFLARGLYTAKTKVFFIVYTNSLVLAISVNVSCGALDSNVCLTSSTVSVSVSPCLLYEYISKPRKVAN
jgi:hypothetical protein